jgi:AraC-like DNA-binding protein
MQELSHLRPVGADVRALLGTSDAEPTFARAHLVVLGARVGDRTPVEATASRLRKAHAHVGIFVVAAQDECAPARLARLARGVDELYLADAPGECERFADHVIRRLGVPAPEAPLRAVANAGTAQHRAGRVAMWLLRNAYRNPSVDEAAEHFGLHRTSLWRLLRGAGLPDPGVILRCGRVLHAVHLLKQEALDHQAVADRLGMESMGGVRMLLGRANRDLAIIAAFQRLGLEAPTG